MICLGQHRTLIKYSQYVKENKIYLIKISLFGSGFNCFFSNSNKTIGASLIMLEHKNSKNQKIYTNGAK